MEFKSITNLKRFKDVVAILLKYGFDDVVQRLALPGQKIARKITQVKPGLDMNERIRLALDELGPTFIKFGQIMSLRTDLLPTPLISELRKLQDEVAPVNFDEIRQMVESTTQRSLDEFFAVFDQKPLAAASLSQVHRAVLRHPRRAVAVKVQRPHIRSKIDVDLGILAFIADRLDEHGSNFKVYDLPNLVRLVRRTLNRELNFKREARYMNIARAYTADLPGIQIPRPYSEYCTEDLLVMEYVQGSKLKDLDPQTLQDPETLAKRGLKAAIKQILEDGFFHADPHPGNLLITENNHISLLDWGMVGRLTQEDRHELLDLVQAAVERDSRKLVDVILLITAGGVTVNRRELEREAMDILDSHFAIPIHEMNLGHLLMDITDMLREYQLRIPPDLYIMIKGLITAEGTVRLIYPQIDVISEVEPQIKQLASRRFGPRIIWRNLRAALTQLITSPSKIPRRLSEIVEKIGRGELRIRFEHENLGELRNTLENIFSRLTFGIIIAAMIMGSSMIITTGVKPFLFGFPAFGVIGYLISGLLGLWLIFDIIRSRRY